ncbi:hypothetical protein [Iodobacter ciconiae]|uniref:Uncharacterized protein n=1 Tax=Iodobacter ciconiae TaxID=2496266 RepID=A0A3S8ZRA1_9NEIS|nr:hypothetical protein [Iodobacter ciconiae]AZN36009.1 hypothetical protein EJO50_05655 [Iodobacter ciconiae]
MASSKVKEIIEQLVVEQNKAIVRKNSVNQRKTTRSDIDIKRSGADPVFQGPESAEVEHLFEVKKGKMSREKRAKRTKLVRDSFTIPEVEYLQLAILKQRCLEAGLEVKKSELLRVGLQALALMSGSQLVKQFDLIEKLKTGRPSKKA